MSEERAIEIIERLARIEVMSANTYEQTKKTNGRVSDLETKVESLEITRAENKGSLKTAGIVSATISTAAYFILGKLWR